MLDDLKYIHERDGQDALGIAEKQWQQLQHNFEVPPIEGQFQNIVYAGMGGSALAGLFGGSWPGYSVPFELSRQYHIPKYVSDKTLFIASSYSGNTEETLSGLAEAEKAGAKIVIIAGGGKLKDIAAQKSYTYVELPKVGQPRFAILYSYKALVSILVAAGLAKPENLEEMFQVADFLRDSLGSWTGQVPVAKNPSKQLAQELMGKSIVVYSGPVLSPTAYKWKISFNENAKNIAWLNQYPELNHNEISGWIAQPKQKPYAVVELHSSLEHERVLKRFEVTERLLSGMRPSPEVVEAAGKTVLEQLLWTMVFGDFTSLYLALLNNVDPSPVDLQENFKKALNN